MRIDWAYCVELGLVITIEQAQQHYLDQPEPRRRFRFECPEQDCREALHPTITGVLYTAPVQDTDKARHMRFQRGPLSEHLTSCPLAEQAEGEALVESTGVPVREDANRRQQFEALDNDDVPDAVAVAEAVGLARELSTDDSPGFVNGLLGR